MALSSVGEFVARGLASQLKALKEDNLRLARDNQLMLDFLESQSIHYDFDLSSIPESE